MNARWVQPLVAAAGPLRSRLAGGLLALRRRRAEPGHAAAPAARAARGPPAAAVGQRGRLDRRDQRGAAGPGRALHPREEGGQLAHRGLGAHRLRGAAGRLLARRRAERRRSPARHARRAASCSACSSWPRTRSRRRRRRAAGGSTARSWACSTADPHLLDLARGHDVRDPARQHLRADHGLRRAPAQGKGRARPTAGPEGPEAAHEQAGHARPLHGPRHGRVRRADLPRVPAHEADRGAERGGVPEARGALRRGPGGAAHSRGNLRAVRSRVEAQPGAAASITRSRTRRASRRLRGHPHRPGLWGEITAVVGFARGRNS